MRIILVFILFLSAANESFAQVKFGIKAGISSYDLGRDSIMITDDQNEERFTIGINQAEYGFHAGVVLQVNLNGFVIQPEVVWNTNRVDYRITDVNNVTQIISESFQFLDIPILFGTKAGPLRLNIGPVGHVFLNNTSGLLDFDGYKEDFSTVTFGYQAGIGLDFWRLLIDVRYEGNLNNFGDHMSFFGQQYTFSDQPRRLLASVAFVF